VVGIKTLGNHHLTQNVYVNKEKKKMSTQDFGRFLIDLQKDYYKTEPLITVHDTLKLLSDIELEILNIKYKSREYTELEIKWFMLYRINPSIEVAGLNFKHEQLSINN
jgi:hypothetical protein